MTDTQSLGTTLKNDLTNNLSVSIVSAVLAVPALFAFTALSDGTIGGFFLIFNIGVSIPYAYERYWPVAYSTGTATIWTLSAALITAGVFIGVYQIIIGIHSGHFSLIIAFVVTEAVQYGIAALFARIRRK